MKFTIKFTDDDGRVVIDIEDRGVKLEDVYTVIPQLIAEFSDAIGEPIIPYMIQALALAQFADQLGYPAQEL